MHEPEQAAGGSQELAADVQVHAPLAAAQEPAEMQKRARAGRRGSQAAGS